jgi:hypothetical protein
MEAAPKATKGGAAAGGKKGGGDEAGGGGGDAFTIPAGYFEHYLKGGEKDVNAKDAKKSEKDAKTEGAGGGDAKADGGGGGAGGAAKSPVDELKGKDPTAALATLAAMPDGEFDKLTRAIDAKQEWQQLAEAIGPKFEHAIGERRYAPLAAALVAHPDGVCELDERTRLLQTLARLTPFEATALRHVIDEHGSAQKLATLLGPELKMWHSGGHAGTPREQPKDDPKAALAAVRKLEQATLRRLVERLDAGATGPALADALGSAHDQYVRDYWDAAVAPDAQVKRGPKDALAALARVDVKPLRLLAQVTEREAGREGLPPDAGRAQVEAILKPILKGSIPSPELVRSTLTALERLPLAEWRALVEHTQLDELKQLETTLGERFAQLAADKIYDPLKEALDASPPDRELLEAEKLRWLRGHENLEKWLQQKLADRVAEKATGARLLALFGAARLRKLGLEQAASGPRPPAKPRVQVAKEQRKAALDGLKRFTPAQFAQVRKEVPLHILFKFATALAAGIDDELGRALLKHLPQLRDDEGEPLDAAIEDAHLRGFFERLSADERSRNADDPKQQKTGAEGAQPERKRKREDEEGAPMHDGLDVPTLYHQLSAPHLKSDGQDKESSAEDRVRTVTEFQKLPPLVQRALVDHMHAQGTYEELVRLLGREFATATS